MDKVNNPLVSIVFTSYNHKEYLKQALDSLTNQTYPNLEIIIIDDCSSDGSQEILKQYEHIENITLKLQVQNSGSYVKASNYGASFAKGEYILFAQCDDFAESNQIEILVAGIETNPSVGVVFSKSYLIDENGNVFTDDFVGRERSFKEAIKANGLITGCKMKEFLSFSCVIPNLSAALIKHNLFKKIGGLSENYLVVADWEFWLDLSEITDFYYIKQPLNYFRQHATTIRSSIKIKTQILEIYKMFYQNIDKNNFNHVKRLKIGAGGVWFSFLVENKKAGIKCFTSVYNEIKKIERCAFYYFILGASKHIWEYLFIKINKK